MRKHRKNKKYYKYRNYTALFVVVVAIVIGAIQFFKYISLEKDYVLKINDEYIYKEEFLLYLYEQERVFEEIGGVDIWYTDFDGVSAREVAKNNTITSISLLKAIVYQAQNLGITLSEEDKTLYKKEAEKLKEYIQTTKGTDIDINICEKYEKEKMIEEKVYDYFTSSFVVDEDDFQAYYENYLNENKRKIKEINLDYIFVKNNEDFDAKEKAEEILSEINIDTNFESFSENENVFVHNDINLEKDMFESNIQDKLYQLSENSISNVIQGIDGFYIFKVNSISEPNMEQVKETIKQEYITNKKTEIYTNETKIWQNSIKIEKNSAMLSQL